MLRWRTPVSTLVLLLLALGCWLVMFLAGTDVWHAAGRPDFWNKQEPPGPDLRAFAYAFYALFVLLVANLLVMMRLITSDGSRARGY